MRQCWAAWKTVGVAKALTCKTRFQNPLFMWPAWELKMLFIFILMFFFLWCPYFSTLTVLQQSCHPWRVEKGKSILSCHVMREQTNYVLTGNVWRLDVCQNAHHFAGMSEPSNVQVPCVKGPFVFRITRMLLCVFHCSPWMTVTFCCPMKGNQNLEWADGSQWDCCPFSLHKGPRVNTEIMQCSLSVLKVCGVRSKGHCLFELILNPNLISYFQCVP